MVVVVAVVDVVVDVVTVVVVVVVAVAVVLVLVHGSSHKVGQSFCVFTLSKPSVANEIAPNRGSSQFEHAKKGCSVHSALTVMATTVLPSTKAGDKRTSGKIGSLPAYPTVVV